MSNFGVLKENVSAELGLDETASGSEDVLLGRRLNQAVRRVLLLTKCYVIKAQITLAASDDEYELDTALSTNPLAVHSIKNSDGDPLERVSVEEIHELRRGSNPTGTNVRKYALDGANLLLIYPTPSAAGTLDVYYTPLPTEMDSDDDDPVTTAFGGIPLEFHDALEYYASMRMASMDDDSSSGMGVTYQKLFDAEIVKIRSWVRDRGGRRLGPARVGRPGFRRVPRDPSADVYR